MTTSLRDLVFVAVRRVVEPSQHRASQALATFASFPVSWDKVADSIWLGLCWFCCYSLKCCTYAVQHVHSAADRFVHFCSQLLKRHEVCRGDKVCSGFCCSCRPFCCCRKCGTCPRICSIVFTRGVVHRRSAIMPSATLFLGTT